MALENDIIALQTQLTTKEAEVNALYNTYITESETPLEYNVWEMA